MKLNAPIWDVPSREKVVLQLFCIIFSWKDESKGEKEKSIEYGYSKDDL